MTKLINCTPHQITIYAQKDCMGDNPRRLFVDKNSVTPLFVIPPSGVILNAKTSVVDVEIEGFNNLFVKQSFDSVENPLDLVSNATNDDIFIVSALFKSAAKETGLNLKFASVQGVVYDNADVDNPRPCGCLKLDIN